MLKKLTYKEVLILSVPPSFLIGPLILEIVLVVISILVLYEIKKEELKKLTKNISILG